MTDGSVGVRLGRRIAAVAGATVRGVRELATASPSRFAVLVFSTLILVFTGLFSLPAASATGIRTPFADALFTAEFFDALRKKQYGNQQAKIAQAVAAAVYHADLTPIAFGGAQPCERQWFQPIRLLLPRAYR